MDGLRHDLLRLLHNLLGLVWEFDSIVITLFGGSIKAPLRKADVIKDRAA